MALPMPTLPLTLLTTTMDLPHRLEIGKDINSSENTIWPPYTFAISPPGFAIWTGFSCLSCC